MRQLWICIVLSYISSYLCVCYGLHSYEGHKVIRATPLTDQHLIQLRDLQKNFSGWHYDHGGKLEFWREPSRVKRDVHIRIHPDHYDSVMHQLKVVGLSPEILINDMKRAINEQKTTSGDFLTSYHPYDEIVGWLHEVVADCHPRCLLHSIGNSTEGRPLYMLQINALEDRPGVFIDAGVHCREWVGPATAIYMIKKLIGEIVEGRQTEDNLVDKFNWYILPLANPDGYVYTWTTDRMWRKTRSVNAGYPAHCHGTDLNRNWEFFWGGEGTSRNPCDAVYRGAYPFSEPEARAMSNFIWRYRDKLLAYLSFHSYGQYWLTPWGWGRRVPVDYEDLITVGRMATDTIRTKYGTEYTLGSAAATLYPAAGGSDDWAKGRAKIKYSYTVELKDDGRYGFLLPPTQITQTSEEIYDAIGALATALNTNYVDSV